MANRTEMTPVTRSDVGMNAPGTMTEIDGIDDGLLKPSEQPGFVNPSVRRPIDVNRYATKKTVAQGMMDLALLTANSNQLRYALESEDRGAYFVITVTLISLSIILQLTVGIGLIFLGRYNIIRSSRQSERLNNWIILGILLITVMNIFVSAFAMHREERIDPALIINAYKESLENASEVEIL